MNGTDATVGVGINFVSRARFIALSGNPLELRGRREITDVSEGEGC